MIATIKDWTLYTYIEALQELFGRCGHLINATISCKWGLPYCHHVYKDLRFSSLQSRVRLDQPCRLIATLYADHQEHPCRNFCQR